MPQKARHGYKARRHTMRLAAKLTGWKIDIKSQAQAQDALLENF